MGDASRAIEGPVTGGDELIVDQMDGTFEDVQRVLVDPAIPVTFVELLTIGRMSEESRPVADLRAQRLVVAGRSHAFQNALTVHILFAAGAGAGRRSLLG